jgi:hypothetical protein
MSLVEWNLVPTIISFLVILLCDLFWEGAYNFNTELWVTVYSAEIVNNCFVEVNIYGIHFTLVTATTSKIGSWIPIQMNSVKRR